MHQRTPARGCIREPRSVRTRARTHMHHPHLHHQIQTSKSSHQSREQTLPFLHSNPDGSAVALHCLVVYCNFSPGLFISLRASFYGAAFGAGTPVCLGITHQSSSRPDLRGQCRGRRSGEVGPLQSPLCGPSWHLLMRDATHTPMGSFLPDLSSSYSSFSSLLPSTLSSCRHSSQTAHWGASWSPPPPSTSASGIPHLPLPHLCSARLENSY